MGESGGEDGVGNESKEKDGTGLGRREEEIGKKTDVEGSEAKEFEGGF